MQIKQTWIDDTKFISEKVLVLLSFNPKNMGLILSTDFRNTNFNHPPCKVSMLKAFLLQLASWCPHTFLINYHWTPS